MESNFLDEPTSGLDPEGAVLFRKIIEEEKKKGTMVFLTTHNMLDADLLCDRVAFIADGEIKALDSPGRLKEKTANLVLAIFILTPVYLVGQTGITWEFMNYHPMYHLFMAMKDAYFGVQRVSALYYIICLSVIMVLFLAVRRSLASEMAKEG